MSRVGGWRRALVVSLVVLPTGVLAAPDFDVTMEVVAPGETFDAAIVNRITLPAALAAPEASGPRSAVPWLPLPETTDGLESAPWPSGHDGGNETGGLPDLPPTPMPQP